MANLIKQYGTRFAKYATERVKVYETPLVTSNLQMYYPFDHNPRDYSMNDRDLTSFSGSYGVSPSKFNGAAYQPDAIYVPATDTVADMPLRTAFNEDVSCSACGWFYFSSLPANPGDIVSLLQISGPSDGLLTGQDALNISLYYQNDAFGVAQYRVEMWGTSIATSTNGTYTVTPSLNTWYFIYLRFSGNSSNPAISGIEFRINNSIVLSTNYGKTTSFNTVGYFPRIGVGTGRIGSKFDGYIDDVAFFNRVLTSTELTNIYTATRPIRELP